jgi:hypothetical protein
MSWEVNVHNVILRTENVGFYIQKGLNALKTNSAVAGIITNVPVLAKFSEKLLGLIPIVGEAESILEIADFGVENWDAIIALGAVMHFKPFDSGAQDLQSKTLADRAIPGG